MMLQAMKKRRRREITKETLRTPIKPVTLSTGYYFYVWGRTVSGRTYIDGPYSTEDEAWQGGYQALDGDFRVVKLETRDLRTATRVIKRMDLEETKSIEQSLMRARHQL